MYPAQNGGRFGPKKHMMILRECGVGFKRKVGLDLDKNWDVAMGGLHV